MVSSEVKLMGLPRLERGTYCLGDFSPCFSLFLPILQMFRSQQFTSLTTFTAHSYSALIRSQ
jgi:hypothetical protein